MAELDCVCAFWISKRQRFCRSKPLPEQRFCMSHLNSTQITNTADICCPALSSSDTVSVTSNLTHCLYWLTRKRRFCKLRPVHEDKFCAEHLRATENLAELTRIPCPYDPSHSCNITRLENHLKKCNARFDLLPIYYVKGVNSGELDGACSVDFKVGIHDISTDELFATIEIVYLLHKEFVRDIEMCEFSHPVLEEELNNPTNGVIAQKHIRQQASLIGHVDKMGLLKNDVNYIEFGAGKGGLSHWLQRANISNCNTQFILVDKSSVRYKKDCYHKGNDQLPTFERLKIDIENLSLALVPSLKHCKRPTVSIGKHLCGAATDFMLRCVVNTMNECVSNDECRTTAVCIVLAVCCHHRCDWKSYVGKHWFSIHGLSARQFHLMVSMSAWATCGSHNAETDSSIAENLGSNGSYHSRYGNLDAQARENVGIKCKQLIDAGRVHYLEDNGFDSQLVFYAAKSVTLENVAILARKN